MYLCLTNYINLTEVKLTTQNDTYFVIPSEIPSITPILVKIIISQRSHQPFHSVYTLVDSMFYRILSNHESISIFPFPS